MGQGQKSNQYVNPNSYKAMEQFKYEVANELGIPIPQNDYWGDLPSRQNGAIGGHMVRRMIAAAEQSLVEQATANVKAGFQQALSAQNQNYGQNMGQTNKHT